MKPVSKFANLGPPGLARRMAPADKPKASPPVRTVKELAKALDIDAGKLEDRVKRWRKANPELYRERQRAYAKKYRARKKNPSVAPD